MKRDKLYIIASNWVINPEILTGVSCKKVNVIKYAKYPSGVNWELFKKIKKHGTKIFKIMQRNKLRVAQKANTTNAT